MSEKRTFGAASRSSPSLRWNSSRYSSGTRPTSRNDITCPSFIAAPFIVPSAETICWAASTWRRSSACCLPSSPRVRLAVAVPSWRAAWPAARPVTRAVREMREVGIRSLAMPRGYGRAAPASRPARAWRRWAPRSGVRCRRLRSSRRRGRRRRLARGRRRRRRPRPASPSGGRRGRASASAWPSWTCRRRRSCGAAREDGVAEDRQLGRGDDDGGDRERQQAGDERQRHAPAREEAAALGLAQAERVVRLRRIDLEPLLLGVVDLEVAAAGLAHRGALGRLAPDPDGLDLLDGLLEAPRR